jgi:hypothetical protein
MRAHQLLPAQQGHEQQQVPFRPPLHPIAHQHVLTVGHRDQYSRLAQGMASVSHKHKKTSSPHPQTRTDYLHGWDRGLHDRQALVVCRATSCHDAKTLMPRWERVVKTVWD